MQTEFFRLRRPGLRAHWWRGKMVEEPGHWAAGGWELTLHCGWVGVRLGKREWPQAAKDFLEQFSRDLKEIAAKL
jgi:hypothetical protein